MPRATEVRALAGHRLWLSYDDGTEGELDLSSLVGRGAFQAWKDVAVFEAVRLGPFGEIAWGEEIDLCPDALYLRLTGKQPEQVFPGLAQSPVNA